MKKVLLVVAMLLAASQVMAGVTITATNEGTYVTADGNRAAVIRVSYSSDIDIRAFALSLNIDMGGNFWSIRDFNVGENNGTKNGYGIFPGRFRQFVLPQNPSWGDANGNSNYNPTPPWADPGTTNTGIGFATMIVEMGYLGAGDSNKPALSGTLFRVDVNGYEALDANLTITADTMRGGVVSKDTNATTTATNLPYTTKVVYRIGCTTPTNEVGQPKATAEGVWTTQGFTNLVGVGVVNCAQLGNIITNDQNCIALGTQLNYTYGIAPTVPNVVGQPEATATGNIVSAGCCLGTKTTASSCTVAAGNVISTSPVAGTVTCTCVDYVVSTGPGGVPAVPASITVPATDADGSYAVTWATVTGAASYQLESSAPASGTTIFPLWKQIYSGTALTFTDKVGGGTWSYRVMATNACGSSAYRTGGNNCVVTNCLVGGNAGTSENPDWVKWRYPACWCYSRQCRGDVNGKKTGPNYVQSLDFSALTAAFGKTDAQLAAISNGICADLNHKKSGPNRVQALDFTILTTYFGKIDASVPMCSAAPVITGPYTYWTLP